MRSPQSHIKTARTLMKKYPNDPQAAYFAKMARLLARLAANPNRATKKQ